MIIFIVHVLLFVNIFKIFGNIQHCCLIKKNNVHGRVAYKCYLNIYLGLYLNLTNANSITYCNC